MCQKPFTPSMCLCFSHETSVAGLPSFLIHSGFKVLRDLLFPCCTLFQGTQREIEMIFNDSI